MIIAGFLAAAPTLWATDWLHYRGPSQNGVSNEKLPAQFPAEGPRQIWKANVGVGTSSITVSGDHAYTLGNAGGKDVLYCLDTKSGKERWRFTYPSPLDKRMFEGGPAATPTLDGAHVFTVSDRGDLFCVDAATGKSLWSKNYVKDFGGRRPRWGFAGSPVVDGNALLLDVGAKGASTVALDTKSGNVIWKSGDDEAGYASPVVATIGGVKTVVIFKAANLVGLNAKDGKELWRTPWETSYDVNAATPIVVGNQIFISSGYDTGCALIEVSGGKAQEKWRNKSLRAQINTPVVLEGHVYGIDGQADPKSPLVCLEWQTGKEKWRDKSVGGGSLILAGNKLVILTERGELVMGDASANGFKASTRAQVLGKRCWVQPTLANGQLFCRNNDGALVCLAAGK